MKLDKSKHDPEQIRLAEKVAEKMMLEDYSSHTHQITLLDIAPGEALFEMTVTKEKLNGYGICHGGILYLLADTAFAYAANSDNTATLTSSANIEYFKAAQLNDQLTAYARLIGQSGNISTLDVEITNQEGELLSIYRGRGYRLKKQVVPSV